MKKKILGLTMNVTEDTFGTQYEFLNPVSLSVLNSIIIKLGSQYEYVRNFTDTVIVKDKEYYTGYLRCKNREQLLKYWNIPQVI